MMKRDRRGLTPGKGNQKKTGFSKVLQTKMFYQLNDTLLPSRKNNKGGPVALLSGKSVMSIFLDAFFRDLGPVVHPTEVFKTHCAIHRIVIYPVGSVIHFRTSRA